jgi:Domain of unknown function (DUF1850)
MKRPAVYLLLGSVLLLIAWLPSRVPLRGMTRFILEDPQTGREIFSTLLEDGEAVTLTWRNSIFGQDVMEVFHASGGELVLNEVTFTDPDSDYQMPAAPEDVDDLYHTGGPFSARGLSRSFHRINFLIGEIGNPKFQVQGQVIELKKEVGFGGRVVLTARPANLYEYLFDR